MSMNQILAEFYKTNGAEKTASAEDHEKAAQYELFTKIAQSNGIDIGALSDAQVQELYEKTFSKTAGEMPPQFAKGKADGKEEGKKEEKEEIEEAAKKEHEEKKASAEKLAEADFLGRVMAHAYVNERQKIAEDRTTKTAGINGSATGEWKVELPKVASAIDTLAMTRAFDIVREHNAAATEYNKTAAADKKATLVDEKDAATKIAAVHTKGLGESMKVASAVDHKAAVEVRALETLEAAGFPVEWT
jgi:hypothetical protein